MPPAFYEKAGARLSPGDIFQSLPIARLPKPLRVVRKVKITLPPKIKSAVRGDLREIFEVGKDVPNPGYNFDSPGEETVSYSRISMAIFLTWGSEVDSDVIAGKLNKKDWLIAPLYPLGAFDGKALSDPRTGSKVDLGQVIREGKSPKYFPLPSFPNDNSSGYYVDFRKIFPLAASYFEGLQPIWRLAPMALNDFYSQLLWFFTRKKIFFGPVPCEKCGAQVDLGVTFEGQRIEGEQA
jgi:hypothetical protein